MSARELIGAAFDRLSAQGGFADRPQQRQLALMLSDCIADGKRGLFEAPTGLGKSLAALVPAVAHAITSGKRTIVATYTNLLAEQYWRNDLPLALSLFDQASQVRSQYLIGRQRYACRAAMREAGGSFGEFARHAKLGIESEFRLLVPKPPREVAQAWQAITAPPVCPARLCDHYDDCWYYAARRSAQKAHVVITNHSVVLQDALLRTASGGDLDLLGTYDFLIVDEAHDFPQAAANGLEFELSPSKAQQILGVVRRFHASLKNASFEAGEPHVWTDLCEGIMRRLSDLGNELARVQANGILVATPMEVAEAPLIRSQIQSTAIEAARVVADSLASDLSAFTRAAEQMLRRWIDLGCAKAEDQEVVHNYLMYLREFAGGCSSLFQSTGDDLVSVTYALGTQDWRGQAQEPILRRDLVGLAEPLQGLLWDRTPYACLSATLAIDRNFEFFRRFSGAEGDYEEVLPSPFDFPNCMALYVPPKGRVLDPAQARAQGSESAYHQSVAREVASILEAMRGRCLVLFHSRKEMEAVHQLVPSSEALPILMQRTHGAASTGEKFLRDAHASLFALRSFWTGFDAPGETLSCVVLVRVPFEVPVDPPAMARMAWLQNQGLDPFVVYTLPQAKMMMRQGAGRLIRRAGDRGVVALLDPRLRTKGYGEQFFENMPPGVRSFDDIYEAMAAVGLS